MEQEVTGYVDRIEDGRFAVLLVDSLGKEFIVDISELPEGVSEGLYVKIILTDGEIREITAESEKTEAMEQKIADQLQRIKSKSSRSRFKRR